jgi:NAD-dependent dihydropyrimidine dehydrogenase PreA subunit
MSLFHWLSLASRRQIGAASQAPIPAPHLPDPHENRTSRAEPPAAPEHKWVPVIDTDACIGCERCVAACDHGCLEMIWSFSNLTHPHQCTGEGHCVEACPEKIIHMEWVLVEAESEASPSQAAGLPAGAGK